MATISPQEIIDTAKRMLKLTNTNEYDADFVVWLEKGFRKLYNLKTYLPLDAYLPFANGRVKLPKGFEEFVGAAIQSNTPVIYYNNKYLSSTTAPTEINVTYYDYFNSVQILNGYLDFGSLHGTATECHLWYKGIPYGEDCNLVIEADAEEPLKYFLAWKFSEENNGVDFEKKIPYYAGMFDKEAGILRGHIAKRDSRQRGYEIASTANGVLNFYPY